MTSIRKLIGKLAGRENGVADELRVRAFGKLPVSREYLHLDAGEGPAKAFADWIKAGHDDWVRRIKPADRGSVVPTCFSVHFPELGDYAAVGCIWASRDGATSPRAFPFSLFVLVRWSAQESCLRRFVACEHLWSRLQEWFEPLYEGRMALADLQDRQLTPLVEMTAAVDRVADEARQIDFKQWLRSVWPATGCGDEEKYLTYLAWRIAEWRRQAGERGFAARLPLSRDFAARPQIAAWLNWLDANLGDFTQRLTGLWAPPLGLGLQAGDQQHARHTEPALAVAYRPLTHEDFQLATSNVHEHAHIDDATRPGDQSRAPGARSENAPRLAARQTLWDLSTLVARCS